MDEVLDDQPLFGAVMWPYCNVLLEMFPGFRDGFILELLKIRNPITQGVGFAPQKILGQEDL